MREQVITPRAGRGGAAGRAAAGQRPAARHARPAGKARGRGGAWGLAVAFVPLAAKVLLAAGLGVLCFAGYRAAASAAFFRVQSVDIEGTSRASREEVKAAVLRTSGASGVWRADLAAISRDVRSVPWVRTAVVSRVLPSGLRVRVTEREPRLIARAASGRLVWVDDEGVMLGGAAPADNDFIIRGLDEGAPAEARQPNRERVRAALELKREWGQAGLAGRVSEINLEDLRDVRVQLAGDDARVEVRLGREDFARRFREALGVLDQQRRTPRGPLITYVDVTQGKRAVVGFAPGARIQDVGDSAAAPGDSAADASARAAVPPAAARQPPSRAAAQGGAAGGTQDARGAEKGREKKERDKKEGDKKERGKKDTAAGRQGAATRPRRAG